MLNKTHNKFTWLTLFVGVVLAFDIATIISNIFISPILEGYGLPDVLIYSKTFVFLLFFIILIVWRRSSKFNLTKPTLKILLYLSLFTIVAYFSSLYLYKYVLIVDTADIIKNNILYGNPYLIFDFSTRNYKTLTYITTIFGGFNSEIILFVEAMILEFFCIQASHYEVQEEKAHAYDIFLYDSMIFNLFAVLALSSFLSINLFVFRYDLMGSIEMAIAIFSFMLVISGIFPIYKLNKTRGLPVTKSFFAGTYRLILVISILVLLSSVALFVINNIYIGLGTGNYRIATTTISVLASIILIYKIRSKMILDNK